MGRTNTVSRRQLLAAAGAAGSMAIAGCGAVRGDVTGDGTDEGEQSTPTPNQRGSDEVRTIEVRTTVLGSDGPMAGVEVRLRYGSERVEDLVAQTGSHGRHVFEAPVAPNPCNELWLVVPAYDREQHLGCLYGDTIVERELHVDARSDRPSPDDPDAEPGPVEYPVVDNGSDRFERNLYVDLRVVDSGGAPLSDADVLLQDRGGTPDDRLGRTGPSGRIRFVESVGPPPCNRQTVLVPGHDVREFLGCNDGGRRIEREIVVR